MGDEDEWKEQNKGGYQESSGFMAPTIADHCYVLVGGSLKLYFLGSFVIGDPLLQTLMNKMVGVTTIEA